LHEQIIPASYDVDNVSESINNYSKQLTDVRMLSKRAMITIEELEAIDDPLELFKLTSEAIIQRQIDIDRLADIRTRSAAALYARGISYRDMAKMLDLSAPRLSQLVSANEGSVLTVLKAWAAIEQKIVDFASSRGLDSAYLTYNLIRPFIQRSNYFDAEDMADLDELQQVRNSIVHGRIDVLPGDIERLTEKAIHLNAKLLLAFSEIEPSEIHGQAGIGEPAKHNSPERHRNSWASTSLRAGLQFGPWTLTRRLGKGGNGEVWETRGVDARPYAIKIFRYGGPADRLRRFKDEIKFLSQHRMNPGILPLLDSSLTTNSEEQSWYVMPKAIPIKVALGSDPEPSLVVGAISTIASTLADLADRGIYHRDIKPANLFRLGDNWVIGDFGLAKYPDKDPVTQHGVRLGPIDYMAPEMRKDADIAGPGPADVWALAKTLWVLLTGYSLPLPGPHRAGDPAYMLYGRIRFDRSRELDRLLEWATQIEPEARITMREVASELLACIAAVPEARPSADLPMLATRVATLTDPERRKAAEAQERRNQILAAGNELTQLTQDVSQELQEILDFDSHTDSGRAANQKLGLLDFPPHSWYSTSISLVPPGQRPVVKVLIATAMRIMHEGEPANLAAVLNVSKLQDGLEDVTEIWSATFSSIPIGSARQAQAFASIRAGLVAGFEPAVRKVAEILAEN
jgi:serine/threonine protein kinase/predicted transcriptional regulator